MSGADVTSGIAASQPTAPTPSDYLHITELSGDEVSAEQIERMCHRYLWAGDYCRGKEVLEAGCGTGQGLGYLQSISKSLVAGDYSHSILARAAAHYAGRVSLQQFDAQKLPFADRSLDVVILFEAIYYVPSAELFVAECKRVLRPGGVVLIASANKDLYDFNPSPQSFKYYGVVEFQELFERYGFAVECFGYCSVEAVSLRQRILRPVKRAVVSLGLMPKTADGKKWLKRLVFGKLVPLPAEIHEGMLEYVAPQPVPRGVPDRKHKVIYCAATLPGGNA